MEVTQLLRARVLDLAVRGKLVPQDPHDEPASELLSSIDEERMRLFKEGRIKKKDFVTSRIYRDEEGHFLEKVGKEAPVCIDDEIPFDIPETWQWVRGEFAFIPMRAERPNTDFVYIDIDAVNNKSNKIDNPKFTKLSSAPSRASRKVNTGDVLFSMVRPYLRNIALVTDDLSDAIASTGFYVITPSCAFVSRFVFYACLSSYVVDGLNERMRGDNSPSIKTSDVLNFLFPLPPLAEQRRIVDIVDKAFESIRDIETSVASLDRYKQSLRAALLEEAIRGRLVEQRAEEGRACDLLPKIEKERKRLYEEGKLKKKDLVTSHIYKSDDGHFFERVGKKAPLCIDDQIPFDIPDSWQWVRGEFAFLPMQSERPSSDFTYIDIDAVNNKSNKIDNPKVTRLSDAPSRASRKVNLGDVLFSMVRPYLRNIALVTDDLSDAIASTGFYVITPSCAFESRFVFYACLSPYVVDGLNERMRGDNSPSIKTSDILSFLFPQPPLAEQRRIVERLDQLMAEVEKL